MSNKPVKIRCSTCGKGKLRLKTIDHDVGPLLDMTRVFVKDLPALVCGNCGAISLIGHTLDTISMLLAVEVLQLVEIAPLEVRYLRKLLGDTQDEFAARLNVVRATANRWENSDKPVSGPEAYAIRTHVFFRLRDKHPVIESVAPAFTSSHPAPRKRMKGYMLNGAELRQYAV